MLGASNQLVLELPSLRTTFRRVKLNKSKKPLLAARCAYRLDNARSSDERMRYEACLDVAELDAQAVELGLTVSASQMLDQGRHRGVDPCLLSGRDEVRRYVALQC